MNDIDAALDEIQDLNHSHEKAHGLINIGLAYHDLRRHLPNSSDLFMKLASETFNEAAVTAQNIGDLRLASYAWGHLGHLYEEAQRYQDALQLTRKAVFAAQQANLKGGNWLIASPKEGGTAWIDYWVVTKAAIGLRKRLCEEWINYQLSPSVQVEVVKSQGVSPVVDNVAPLVTSAQQKLFHVGDNEYFKTVAIWQVMSEKTEKAFDQMWEEAKKHRK